MSTRKCGNTATARRIRHGSDAKHTRRNGILLGALLLGLCAAGAAPASVPRPGSAVDATPATGAAASLHALGVPTMPRSQRRAAPYNKLDGTLLTLREQYAATQGGGTAALSALHAGSPQAKLLLLTPSAVPYVALDSVAAGNPQALATALRQLGAQHLSVFSNVVGALLPVSAIEAAANLPQLRFARAALSRPRTGMVPSQGDFVQYSDVLRASTLYPGLDGSGVTVGVLSNSFDCFSQYGQQPDYAADVSSGDLPVGVQVLEEGPCYDPIYHTSLGMSDEGRAITQIVHDVAPGAGLAFYSADFSEADFANGILALAKAGAKVIDDDVGYFDEPYYQDGIVAQAIDQVHAQGVAYFSSAGNNGRQSYDANAAVFDGTGAAGDPNAGEALLNFDPSGATQAHFLPITVPGQATVSFILHWDQPYASGAPDSSGATGSMDLCLTDDKGALLFCSGPSTLSDDPVIVFGVSNNGDSAAPAGLMVGVAAGIKPGRVKITYATDGAGGTIDAFQTASSTLQGHPGAAGGMAVGAAFYFNTPRCGTLPDAVLESFSAAGGEPLLFDQDGGRLAQPQLRNKPELVAPDGVSNTLLGYSPGTVSTAIPECALLPAYPNFFGTSAAAPHAAGVAALLLQAAPQSAPDDIYTALEHSAQDMGPSGFDFDSGYGLLRADAAAAALLPPGISLSPTSVDFGNPAVGSDNSKTITVTSSGKGPLLLGDVSLSGSGFKQSNDCPATLAPQASCTVTVGFTPAASQSYSGTLSISSSAGNGTTAALTGSGASSGGGAIAPGLLLAFAAAALARLRRAWRIARRPLLRLFGAATVSALMIWPASATDPTYYVSERVLHSFYPPEAADLSNPGGYIPQGPLLLGSDGALYGTAPMGGAHGVGDIFRIDTGGNFKVLYSPNGLNDGAYPMSGVILGSDGNFYGATVNSGNGGNGLGTLYQLTPGGQYTVLYTFTGDDNGAYPNSLVQGTDGALYGTTGSGGANNWGTVFRITTGGQLTTLHAFDFDNDGGGSQTGLTPSSDGSSFYGITETGGSAGAGTLFSIDSAGHFTLLHQLDDVNDGADSVAPLLLGQDGYFYGTTQDSGPNGGGTVFRMSPKGVFTVLHAFGEDVNGGIPHGALVPGTDGNLYGTTWRGGAPGDGPLHRGAGTLFAITPAGVFTKLYAFGSNPGSDAAHPLSGMTLAGDGQLYGTTEDGGNYGAGTIFTAYASTIKPPAPAITFSASPQQLVAGGHATLSWSTSNAFTCRGSGDWIGNKAVNGSETVVVASAGTPSYTLTCSNAGGQASGSVSLTVTAPAKPTVTLTATPASITTGASTKLQWTSSNADSCTAGGAWSGALASSGSQTVTPAASGDYYYSLSCSGPGGGASASAQLSVSDAPPPATPSSSGGGALTPPLLGGLALLGLARRRRRGAIPA